MVNIRQEQHMIRTAIIALLVVLACVYILAYSIYYRPSPDEAAAETYTSEQTGSVSQRIVQDIAKVVLPVAKPSTETPVVVTKNQTPSQNTNRQPIRATQSTGFSPASIQTTQVAEGERRVLPGTRPTAVQSLADQIGVEYRYALRDDKGIYYLNLGTSSQDLSALLQAQGGNTFSLDTSTEILANQLFGDRVTYLNLPQYLNQTVLMVIEIQGERWLMQLPYDQYHILKPYLANKFI